KTDAPGKSPLGGGHKFKEWEEHKNNMPYQIIKEEDITKNTAPTMDIVNDFSLDVLQPVWKHLFLLLEDKYPRITKFIKWKFKKKLAKLENKHFKGERNSENFIKYKKYMFYLLQAKNN
ncbi:MAG: hypothetical protein ACOC2M_05195, partial [bacterium]